MNPPKSFTPTSKSLLFLLLSILLQQASSFHCPQGSLPFLDKCVPCFYIAGCAKYAEDKTCSICEYGYHKVNGRCQYTNDENQHCCTNFDNDGNCLQCAPGLELDGNSCYKIQRPGCLYGKGSECQNCAEGYYKRSGKCYRNIPYCESYTNNGYCKKCEENYEQINGLCSRQIDIPVCSNCELKNEYGCVKCQNGYHLTRNRECEQNQKGCLKYFQGSCQLCSPNFNLNNGKCEIDGCLSYESYGCGLCDDNYILKNGFCTIENCLETKQGKCAICSSNTRLKNGKCVKPTLEKCLSCAEGYFVSNNGKCIKIIIGCTEYDQLGRCSYCVTPFVESRGTCKIPGCEKINEFGCVKCSPIFYLTQYGKCEIKNCKEVDYQNLKCHRCEQNFHLYQYQCRANSPLCQQYSKLNLTTEVCSSCYEGYVLDSSYNCIARKPGCIYQDGRCISCQYPFIRNDNYEECIIEGCKEYGNNECVKCVAPFELKRGNCVILNCEKVQNKRCTICESGYHIYEGACFEDDPKCQSYYYNDCVSCVQTYALNKWGKCVKNIKNCIIIGNHGCEQCERGYKIQDGICLLVDANCKTFSSYGCQECNIGYHNEQSKCIKNHRYCLSYSPPASTQVCISCKPQFHLVDKKCRKSEPGCLYQDGVCYDCIQPFDYDEEEKICRIRGCKKYKPKGCARCVYPFKKYENICQIEYCASYNDDNQCIECSSNYTLIQSQCYKSDPKCVKYADNGVCYQCESEYEVFQGICVKEDKNCEKYSKYGGCRKCIKGYYISHDKICLPKQPGCIYQKHKCSYCNHPFNYDKTGKKCKIQGCSESCIHGCLSCRFPYETAQNGICRIPNCAVERENLCGRCQEGYHLKEGIYCVKNSPSCIKYTDEGNCELCKKGYLMMSSGECEVAEPNCIKMKKGKCLVCHKEYFLNRFYQCQKKDKHCSEYNNGVCMKCDDRHFLYDFICFPYSVGCVKYSGKDCIQCKQSYTKKNGECFRLKKPLLKLDGEEEYYKFEITLIDITKSKYYIDNLSPISKLGKVFYSSFYSLEYSNPQLSGDYVGKGWKAQNERSGQYIGYIIEEGEPVTFYAVQLEGSAQFYIEEFYLEYSVDGIQFIRLSSSFQSRKSSNNLITIYFTAIYARAIRIVVKDYWVWPGTKIEFFYYDYLRYRKISNLKSLKYLKESIQSNFVDRIDNQLYINSRFFNFDPAKSCVDKDVCFTGLELCQARTMKSLNISCTEGEVTKFYVTYSLDGETFNCFEKCRQIFVVELPFTLELNGLLAKNVRVYPVQWNKIPKVHISYEYD